MASYVIGCDPDSGGSGFAVFKDGQLQELLNMNVIQLVRYLDEHKDRSMHFAIENVLERNKIFSRQGIVNRARCVGMCQQVQREIMHVLDHFGISYTLYPISKDFKKGAMFKAKTGWQGRSNEETRSAAYFACKHLGVAL